MKIDWKQKKFKKKKFNSMYQINRLIKNKK